MMAKKHIYTFFFLTLLAFKVSAFHVYTHQEEHEHGESCELCEHAISNQLTAFTPLAPVIVPTKPVLPLTAQATVKQQNLVVTGILYQLPFSRPPPVAI